MDHDEFIGQVQNRARLADTGEALRASRATLTTLGERIQEGDAENLAAQLPEEIGRFLTDAETHGERFEFDGFVDRVMEREELTGEDERADAVHHARTVLDVVEDAVTEGQMNDLRDGLPEEEFGELFELAERAEVPVEEELRQDR